MAGDQAQTTCKTVQLKAYLTEVQELLFQQWTPGLTHLWNFVVAITHEEQQRIWFEKGSKAACYFQQVEQAESVMWVLAKTFPRVPELNDAENELRRKDATLALACDTTVRHRGGEHYPAVSLRPYRDLGDLKALLNKQCFTDKWLKSDECPLPTYQLEQLLSVPMKLRQSMIRTPFKTARDNYLKGHTRKLKFKSSKFEPVCSLRQEQTEQIKWMPDRNLIQPFGSVFGAISFRGLHNRHKGNIPRSCSLTKKADGFYLSISFQYSVNEQPEKPFLPVGIDPGVKVFLSLSDGKKIDGLEAEKRIAKAELKVSRLQKQLSRQKLKGQNWQKTKAKLARAHKQAADVRRMYNHKVSAHLTDKYSDIAIENTQLGNMTKAAKPIANESGIGYKHNKRAAKAGLNRAILRRGIGQFREMLKTKAEAKGHQVKAIKAQNSSITCSLCGHVDKESRPTQELFCCTNCGYSDNADLNAAKIIYQRAFEEP